MDSTNAAALAIARRILNAEVARLSGPSTSDTTTHATQPVTVSR
jgi:hypothetical protein